MGAGMMRSGSSCIGQSCHSPVFSSFHWKVNMAPGSVSENFSRPFFKRRAIVDFELATGPVQCRVRYLLRSKYLLNRALIDLPPSAIGLRAPRGPSGSPRVARMIGAPPGTVNDQGFEEPGSGLLNVLYSTASRTCFRT